MPAGSDGLWFLPYLTGERSPHPDPLARGAFVGLTVGHERRHLARAVLEGVAYGLRDGLDQMRGDRHPAPTQIRISGGGIASAAVAPDPGRRARCRDRHRQHHRGRRVRRRPAGGSRRRLVRQRGRRRVALGIGHAGRPSPGRAASVYAEGHARTARCIRRSSAHFHGEPERRAEAQTRSSLELLAWSPRPASCRG